ncbi:MAG: hypothetical protein K2N30_01775, partial [Clostridia bacterium]|nr:hypothetical protein [Clostridia bacterium]
CVFYGTELPLSGEGDPDCRKTFDWSFKNQNADYASNIKRILALKKQPALSGARARITAENGLLKITREAAGESVTALFNASGKEISIECGGEVLFGLNCNGGKLLDGGTAVVKNKT